MRLSPAGVRLRSMVIHNNGDLTEWRKWAHQVLTYLVDHTKVIDRFVDEQRRHNDRLDEYIRKNDERMAKMIQRLMRHDTDLKSLKKGRS